jgi:hypothetical protein
VALLLNDRTGKQCRERFKNHLDPNLVHQAWSYDEDQRLISLHRQLGNQCDMIFIYLNFH